MTTSTMDRGFPRLARRRGILSLPPEILSRIFEMLCMGGFESFRRRGLDGLVKQLSSVCREFRTAVINTASFWTKIDNDFCLRAGFERRMVRSRKAPLILELDLYSGAVWQKVLTRLVPSKHRWRHFVVHFSVDVPSILGAFPSLEFPCLEVLSARFSTREDCDRLLTEWQFPCLTSLTLCDAIPPDGIFHDLTSFELDSCCNDRGASDAFLERLMSFLDQTRSLQRLHLDLARLTGSLSSHLSIVKLPNLSMISVSHGIPKWYSPVREPLSAVIVARILQALYIPNVSEFHLRVRFRSTQDITDWISSFADIPEALQPVTSLEFWMEYSFDDNTLTRFFALFPNVQELKLGAIDLASAIWRGSWELKLDHLHSLLVDVKIVDLLRKQPELLNYFSSNPAQIHVTERC